MGKLLRRTLEGDEEVLEWSAGEPATVEAARDRMREEIDAGYMAVLADGDENRPVTELPVDADTVLLTMPMGGG